MDGTSLVSAKSRSFKGLDLFQIFTSSTQLYTEYTMVPIQSMIVPS